MDHRPRCMDHRALSTRKSFPKSRVWHLTAKNTLLPDSHRHPYPRSLSLEACCTRKEAPRGRKKTCYVPSVQSLLPLSHSSNENSGSSLLSHALKEDISQFDVPRTFPKKEAFVRPVQTWGDTREGHQDCVTNANTTSTSLTTQGLVFGASKAVSCNGSGLSFPARGQVLGVAGTTNRTNTSVPVVRIKPMIRVVEPKNGASDESVVKQEGFAKCEAESCAAAVEEAGSSGSHQKTRSSTTQKRKSKAGLRVISRSKGSSRGRKRICSQRLRCCTGHALWHRTGAPPCGGSGRCGGTSRIRGMKQLCYLDRFLWKRMRNGGVKRAKRKKNELQKCVSSPHRTKHAAPDSPKVLKQELDPIKGTCKSETMGHCGNSVDYRMMDAKGVVEGFGVDVPDSLPRLQSIGDPDPSLDGQLESDMPVLQPSFAMDCDNDASTCSSPEMPTLTPFVDMGDEEAQDASAADVQCKSDAGGGVRESSTFSDDSYTFPDEEDIPYFPNESCDNFMDVCSPHKLDPTAYMGHWWSHASADEVCKRTARKSFARALFGSVECGVKSPTKQRVMPERRARKAFCASCDTFHSVYRHVNPLAASEGTSSIVQYANNPRYQPVVVLPKLNKDGSSSEGEDEDDQQDDRLWEHFHHVLDRPSSSSCPASLHHGTFPHRHHRSRRRAMGLLSRKSLRDEEPPGVQKEPAIDVIDGLEFLSFHTEEDLREYVLRSGSRMDMSFRFSEDSMTSYEVHDGSVELQSVFPEDDLDVGRKEIIPTKTKDITKIKGWKNKHFASSDAHLDKMSAWDALHSSAAANKWQKNISPKSSPSDKDGRGKKGASKDKSSSPLNGHLETDSAVVAASASISPISGLPEFKTKNDKNVKSAFVSDILDEFLRTKAELKIDLLSKFNPNINPPAADSKILSVGSLRKDDEPRPKRHRPAENSSHRSSSSFADDSSAPKRSRNEGSEARSHSDVNDDDSFRMSTPKSAAMLSWDMSPASPINLSSHNSISDDLSDDSLSHFSMTSERTYRDDGFSDKKGIQLIRHTFWTKEMTEETANAFCRAINCSSMDEVEKWRNHTSLRGFAVRGISKGLAQHAVSAMDVGRKRQGPSTAQSNQQVLPKPVKLPPKCQFKSESHSSNIRLMRHPRSPPSDSQDKNKGVPSVAGLPSGPSLDGLLSQNTRSKRSIRLPARYLDSALLVVGSEWVSPGPSVDTQKKHDGRKGHLERKFSRTERRASSMSHRLVSSESPSASESETDAECLKTSCARTSEYLPTVFRGRFAQRRRSRERSQERNGSDQVLNRSFGSDCSAQNLAPQQDGTSRTAETSTIKSLLAAKKDSSSLHWNASESAHQANSCDNNEPSLPSAIQGSASKAPQTASLPPKQSLPDGGHPLPSHPLPPQNLTSKAPVKVNFIVGSKVLPVVIHNAIVAKPDAPATTAAASVARHPEAKARIVTPVIISPPRQIDSLRTDQKQLVALNLLRRTVSSNIPTDPSNNRHLGGIASSILANSASPTAGVQLKTPPSATFARSEMAHEGTVLVRSVIRKAGMPTHGANCSAPNITNINAPKANGASEVLQKDVSVSPGPMENQFRTNHAVKPSVRPLLPKRQLNSHPKLASESPNHIQDFENAHKTMDHQVSDHLPLDSRHSSSQDSVSVASSTALPVADELDVVNVDPVFDPVSFLKICHNQEEEIRIHTAIGLCKKMKRDSARPWGKHVADSSRSNSPLSSSSGSSNEASMLSTKAAKERVRRRQVRELCNLLVAIHPTKFNKPPSIQELLNEWFSTDEPRGSVDVMQSFQDFVIMRAQKYIASIEMKEKRLRSKKEMLLSQQARLRWQLKKLMEEAKNAAATAASVKAESPVRQEEPESPVRHHVAPASEGSSPLTGAQQNWYLSKKLPVRDSKGPVTSQEQRLANNSEFLTLPLSHVKRRSGKVKLRFTGTLPRQPSEGATPCSSLTNSNLNKVAEATMNVVGPCAIKKIRFKTNGNIYTYCPCSKNEQCNVTNDVLLQGEPAKGDASMPQTRVMMEDNKGPSELLFHLQQQQQQQPQDSSGMFCETRREMWTSATAAASPSLQTDATVFTSPTNRSCIQRDTHLDMPVPATVPNPQDMFHRCGTAGGMTVWTTTSREPTAMYVKHLVQDNEAKWCSENAHPSPLVNLPPPPPPPPPPARFHETLPSIVNCSSISEEEFLTALPECTAISSGAT